MDLLIVRAGARRRKKRGGRASDARRPARFPRRAQSTQPARSPGPGPSEEREGTMPSRASGAWWIVALAIAGWHGPDIAAQPPDAKALPVPEPVPAPRKLGPGDGAAPPPAT